MKKIALILVAIAMFFVNESHSQDIAVKSNLLYDATGTMNLGVEFRLGKKLTLDISGNYNPWVMNQTTNKKMKHSLIQPELRYWTCRPFSRHYFGIHAHYGAFNVSGENWLLGSAFSLGTSTPSALSTGSHEGNLYGAGLSYGYQWILGKRWGLEANIGVGYAYMDYNLYEPQVCGTKIGSFNKHYFGITKVGVTLVYIIK